MGTRLYEALSLVVDEDGVAHAAAELNDSIFYLTNASGSWTRERVTTPLEGGSDREPSIALDPLDPNLLIAFTRYSSYECFELGCFPADSTGIFSIRNHGGEWSEPVARVTGKAVRPVMRIGRQGDEHLVYELLGDDEGWVHHVTHDDPGPTPTDTRLGAGHSASLALGADGLPHVCFLGDDGVLYATAESASGPFDVQATGIEGWAVVLLGANDQPHLVYTGFDEPWSIHHTTWDGTAWTSPTLVAANELLSAAALSADGAIHVIYDVTDAADEDDHGLWYSSNRSGSYEAVQIDASVRAVPDGPSAASALTLDDDGRPHFLYVVAYDDGRNGLYYAVGPGPQ